MTGIRQRDLSARRRPNQDASHLPQAKGLKYSLSHPPSHREMHPTCKPMLASHLLAIALAQGMADAATATPAAPFIGVFHGQGRGCWGKLYVKTKTLEWNTPYSVCAKTPYTVIDKDMDASAPSIAFVLQRKSRSCRYEIVQLAFDPAYPDYWLARGYASRADYEGRKTADGAAQSRTLSCSVQRQD